MAKLSRDRVEKSEQTQEAVWLGITSRKEGAPPACKPSRALRVLADRSAADVAASAGDVGARVKRFADQVNLDHPELTGAFSSHPRWEKFEDELLAALEAGSPDALNESDGNRRFARFFDRPKPRLLRDTSERDKFRGEKKHVKHVSLKHAYAQGENCFYGRPENLDLFVCGSDLWREQSQEYDRKGKEFDAIAMKEVAATYQRRSSGVRKVADGSCLGFYRLRPDDAALSLARFHDFRWQQHQGAVVVPFGHFEGLSFWQDEKKIAEEPRRYEDIEEMRRMEDVKKWIVFKEKKLNITDAVGFYYQPRLYPLTGFPLPLPKRVSEIVTAAECHPLLNHSPAFDFYWVLVPGLNLTHPLVYRKNDQTWNVAPTGQPDSMKSYKDQMEASRDLDKLLVESGFLMPAVLGERDGRCHFLCLWSSAK